jgi:hypothetical protein
MREAWNVRVRCAVIILRHDLAPGSEIRPLHEGRLIFIGAWQCPGEARSWTEEWAPAWEVELPVRGFHLRASGRRRWVMDPAQAAVHAPGEAYLMASPAGAPQDSTVLRLSEGMAESLVLRPSSGPHRPDAAAALVHARMLANPDPLGREEQALDLAGRILAGRAQPRPGPRAGGAASHLAGRLEEALGAHFTERLTLDRLAALAGTSPFHASRVFRAATGETLHRRLTRLRLRAALHGLRDAQ